MSTTEQQAVTVAQEDREAAAKLFGFPAWENVAYIEDRAMSERIRSAVQAFARHRLASLPCKSGEGADYGLGVGSVRITPEIDAALHRALLASTTPVPDATQTREAELQAEVERLRGLLIDPGEPAWEDARAVLAAEMNKGGYCLHAEYVQNGHPAMVPSHIALNLIAQASRAALNARDAA